MKALKTALAKRRKKTVFQGFWHGPAIGPMRHACLGSFIAMGHGYDLFTYERVAVPEGVRLRNANEIIPKADLFYWDNPVTGRSDISPFSDLFRFKLLHERGGWWSDLDAICLSPDIQPVERAWAQEKPERSTGAIGSSQIAFTAGDPVITELYHRCLDSCRENKLWREIGPDMMTSVVRDLGLPSDMIGTADSFYPIRWIEMFKLWLPQFKQEIVERSEQAMFMPIYASFPQYIGLDMGRLPPVGSYLGEICDKYLTGHRHLKHYTADEIESRTRSFMERHAWAGEELAIISGHKTLERLGIAKSAPIPKEKPKPVSQITKIDTRKIDIAPEEVLCVVGVRNESLRLPHFLDYHRKLGVNRFLCLDNGSDDETKEYLLAQEDCHTFHTEGSHFTHNTDPPNWSNAVLNTFCENHWCVVIDADELLVYPGCEEVPLDRFCALLQDSGTNAMSASMIDMYDDGPVREFSYRKNQTFLQAAPYFDPKPGWLRPTAGVSPPMQMFGGVRERVFWHGAYKKTMPPCLTKVPLVRWRQGMRYLVAQHLINRANLSRVTGALLHFKFLTGFEVRAETEVTENSEVEEKGLQERKVYLDIFKKNPDLAFHNADSVRYRNSDQLVELGWMASTPAYDDFRARKLSGFVLSEHIPIIIYGRAFFDVLGPATALCNYLRGKRAYFLIGNSWTWEDEKRVQQAVEAYSRYRKAYPEHEVIFLCNTPAEMERLQLNGLKAHHVNHNIFVDENTFTVLPHIAKRYDAIYNARTHPLKRHYLGAGIESLALIYYFHDDRDKAYLQKIKLALPDALLLNGPPENYRWLSLGEVTEKLNAARVGLALSEAEGAMKASMEYLLCGVPVVTTPNKGGRDEFFDSEIAITAAADPDSIAEAVRELISRKLDPNYVREKTLQRINAERESFLDFIQGILDSEGAGWRIRDYWPKMYMGNILKWGMSAEQFLRESKLL